MLHRPGHWWHDAPGNKIDGLVINIFPLVIRTMPLVFGIMPLVIHVAPGHNHDAWSAWSNNKVSLVIGKVPLVVGIVSPGH